MDVIAKDINNTFSASSGGEVENKSSCVFGNKEEEASLARVTPDKDIDRSTTESSSHEEEAIYDFLDIEPVQLWQEQQGEEKENAFTEEELINALRSFEEEDEENKVVPLQDFAEGELQVLPELVFETDDDTLLLAPAEFTSSIFNPRSDSNGVEDIEVDQEEVYEEKNGETEGDNNNNNDDDDDDGDDLGLSAALQFLNLNWVEEEEEDDNFDIPPFLYCQPCTKPPSSKSDHSTAAPGFSLPSIAEDKALSDLTASVATDLSQFEKDRPKLPEKEFDALLQLSLLSLEEGGNPILSASEMESIFEKGAALDLEGDNDNKQSQPPIPPHQQQHQQHQREEDQQTLPDHDMYNVSQRHEAVEAAGKLLANFVANRFGPENERSCIGHKETTFGTAFSDCGNYLATASQDSTVRLWDVGANACLTTLTGHSTEHECLRVAWASSQWGKDVLKREKDSQYSYLLATAGADGTVKVWANKDPKQQKESWTCCATIDHNDFDRILSNPDDEAEKPQVYALQWINHWSGLPTASSNEASAQNSFLLTSSDDFLHLWEVEGTTDDENKDSNNPAMKFREVMSLHFSPFHNPGYGVSICQVTKTGLGMQNSQGQTPKDHNLSSSATSPANTVQKPFGGDRNPQNMIFVFDAVYCDANGLLGVALSDGTLRLINGRGICISIMSLPGCQSHLTSFSWDSTGTRLATCVASGHVILWAVHIDNGMGSLSTTCCAILEGGHVPGRPVFGSRFLSTDENLLLSWGVDGRLCVWDSYAQGNIDAPIATLVSKTDFPIYAVDVQSSCIAVGGGGGEATFLGVPVYIYDTDKTGK